MDLGGTATGQTVCVMHVLSQAVLTKIATGTIPGLVHAQAGRRNHFALFLWLVNVAVVRLLIMVVVARFLVMIVVARLLIMVVVVAARDVAVVLAEFVGNDGQRSSTQYEPGDLSTVSGLNGRGGKAGKGDGSCHDGSDNAFRHRSFLSGRERRTVDAASMSEVGHRPAWLNNIVQMLCDNRVRAGA